MPSLEQSGLSIGIFQLGGGEQWGRCALLALDTGHEWVRGIHAAGTTAVTSCLSELDRAGEPGTWLLALCAFQEGAVKMQQELWGRQPAPSAFKLPG